MEIWDLYDKNGVKTGETWERQWESTNKEIPEGRYHIVCEVLVRHKDGTFLLVKRDPNKEAYPGYWEASAGGSALAGEDPLTCVKRELLEETGIVADSLVQIGFTNERKPCLFYSYLAYTNCDKDAVKLQEGETVEYKWVDRAGMLEYLDSDLAIKTHNYRSRRFFEKILKVDALADRPIAGWLKDVADDDFISPYPTYEIGKYFDRFHKVIYTHKDGRSMKYYYFDPREYGYPAGRKYPLLVSFHGSGNSFVGDTVINYTGAEFYASDEYQKTMGGAYILVPVANEYKAENGKTEGGWDPVYDDMVRAILFEFIEEKTEGVTKKAYFGNSSGARYVFHMMDCYMDDFDIAIPIGGSDLPGPEKLQEFDAKGKHLFFALGKRDEFHKYDTAVVPKLPSLQAMKNCFIFTPEWVRNGDGGIASIFGGVEMGQHCLVNSMHINLMFDDHTPMDDRLPNGVTGWLADIFHESEQD